jgi:foldase protein PrsA
VKVRQLWLIISLLILLNIITFTILITKLDTSSNETVATVGEETVSRQDWMRELEERYGKQTLAELIDQNVIENMAAKYDIHIPEMEIERELLIFKTIYGGSEEYELVTEESLQNQIENRLKLEELLTKDVVLEESVLKEYYEQNNQMYNIPKSYHISKIVVETEELAKQTLKELEQGSSFPVLAMERSIDVYSSNIGGDLGYLNEHTNRLSPDAFKAVEKLKVGTWSEPLKTGDGYTILYLHDRITGKNYSFKEMKNQIKREIALEQMNSTISAKSFWDEVGVEWFYESKK